MRQTIILLPISVSLFGRSSQVAVSPCWKMALPDVISTICVKALGPIPRRVPGDLVRLGALLSAQAHRSQDIGLTSILKSSARENSLQCNFNRGGLSRLQSFANVQAPLLARPPGCTNRCDKHRAAGPFTSRNEHVVTRLETLKVLHEL